MKAVRYYGKEDVRVEQVAEPGAIGSHEVRIKPLDLRDLRDRSPRVRGRADRHAEDAASLSPGRRCRRFSATSSRRRCWRPARRFSRVRRGDRISIQPLVMPLDDYYSRRGLNHLSPSMGCIGLSWAWGGMGEIAVINDYNANLIPDEVSNEQGALVEPTAVALYGVDRAKVGGGSTVLITGAGPIGALAVLACHAVGATKIFVSEPNANRRRQIEAFGVTEAVLDPRQDDVLQIVRDATEEGVGVDFGDRVLRQRSRAQHVRRGRAEPRHGRPGRSSREARFGRSGAVGPEGHHRRGDVVLPGDDVAAGHLR